MRNPSAPMKAGKVGSGFVANLVPGSAGPGLLLSVRSDRLGGDGLRRRTAFPRRPLPGRGGVIRGDAFGRTALRAHREPPGFRRGVRRRDDIGDPARHAHGPESVERFFEPYISGHARLALIPMVIIWFGIDRARVAVVFSFWTSSSTRSTASGTFATNWWSRFARWAPPKNRFSRK